MSVLTTHHVKINTNSSSFSASSRMPGAELIASQSRQDSFGTCNYTIDDNKLSQMGWSKIFEDNFDKDLSQWDIWKGGAYNEELQLYQSDNLQLLNSELQIYAKKEKKTGFTRPDNPALNEFVYTSGRIESKKVFSLSKEVRQIRIMARFKIPDSYGLWPAFWTYGAPWPTQGEIDISEARGQEPFEFTTNYFYGRKAGKNLVKAAEKHIKSDVSLSQCYHVYELIWSKNSLKFLFDGVVVDIKTDGYINNLYKKHQKIVLNLAVGGMFFPNLNHSSIKNGTMTIDWVKVYEMSE